MSSLRNAAYRRNHPERPQPQARKKLGLLEKKKDYVKRAKDRHKKEEVVKKLREKARLRNKDEFYFSMIKSKTKNGIHVAERNEKLPDETVRLIKDQYLSYINLKEGSSKKKVESLRQSLLVTSSIRNKMAELTLPVAGDCAKTAKHLIFQGSDSEPEDPYLVNEASESGVQDSSSKSSKDIVKLSIIEHNFRKFRSLKGEFFKKFDIENKLKKVQNEYQLQKNLRSKGARLVIGKDVNGLKKYRWKQNRKK